MIIPAELGRRLPRLILATAVVHMSVGAVESASHWRGILSEGLWNTVANDDDARMTALWFMISGVAVLGIGLMARRSMITFGVLPTETGWILVALGAPTSVLEPVSGGWLLLVLGLLALSVTVRRSGSDQSPPRNAPANSRGDLR